MAVRKALQRADVDELAIAGGRLALEGDVDAQVVDVLDVLAAIPEHALWLEGQDSEHTRAAYRNDVVGFMAFLGIRTAEQLGRVDRGAVIAWKRELEAAGAKPETIRRKLAALSSLCTHLVRHRAAGGNPCRERPVGRVAGSHRAHSRRGLLRQRLG